MPGRIARVALLVLLALALVSCGTRVPDLKGKTIEQATRVLKDSGLALGQVIYDPAVEAAQGSIVSQDPAAGGMTSPGGTVDVTVAGRSVPESVTVPDVEGLEDAAAQEALVTAGFKVIAVEGTHESAKGTVWSQEPAGGQKAAKGSTVRIRVSTGSGEEPPVVIDPGVDDGVTVLLADDFSGAFPGERWVASSGQSINKGSGNPGPCLQLGGTGTGSASCRSKESFDTAGGLTISFDVNTGQQGSVRASIVDLAKPENPGTYVSRSASTNSGAYAIERVPKRFGDTKDGAWHRYEFKVSGGQATWSCDGAEYMTQAFSPSRVYLRFGGDGLYAWVDNVRVTTP